MKAGDTARLKSEQRDAPPVIVTLQARSDRYAGWTVELPDGSRGIALDRELLPVDR